MKKRFLKPAALLIVMIMTFSFMACNAGKDVFNVISGAYDEVVCQINDDIQVIKDGKSYIIKKDGKRLSDKFDSIFASVNEENEFNGYAINGEACYFLDKNYKKINESPYYNLSDLTVDYYKAYDPAKSQYFLVNKKTGIKFPELFESISQINSYGDYYLAYGTNTENQKILLGELSRNLIYEQIISSNNYYALVQIKNANNSIKNVLTYKGKIISEGYSSYNFINVENEKNARADYFIANKPGSSDVLMYNGTDNFIIQSGTFFYYSFDITRLTDKYSSVNYYYYSGSSNNFHYLIDNTTGAIVERDISNPNLITKNDENNIAIEYMTGNKYNYIILKDNTKISNLPKQMIFTTKTNLTPDADGSYTINGTKYNTITTFNDTKNAEYYRIMKSDGNAYITDADFNILCEGKNITYYGSSVYKNSEILTLSYYENNNYMYKLINGNKVSPAFYQISEFSFATSDYFGYKAVATKNATQTDSNVFSLYDAKNMVMKDYTGYASIELSCAIKSRVLVEQDEDNPIEFDGTPYLYLAKNENDKNGNIIETKVTLVNLKNEKQKIDVFSKAKNSSDEIIISRNHQTLITRYFKDNKYKYNYYDLLNFKKVKSNANECPEAQYKSSNSSYYESIALKNDHEIIERVIFIKNGLYGLTDGRGKILIQPVYDKISLSYYNYTSYIITKGLYSGIADINGKIIVKPEFIDTSSLLSLPFIALGDLNNIKISLYGDNGKLLIKDADDGDKIDTIGKTKYMYFKVLKDSKYYIISYYDKYNLNL